MFTYASPPRSTNSQPASDFCADRARRRHEFEQRNTAVPRRAELAGDAGDRGVLVADLTNGSAERSGVGTTIVPGQGLSRGYATYLTPNTSVDRGIGGR